MFTGLFPLQFRAILVKVEVHEWIRKVGRLFIINIIVVVVVVGESLMVNPSPDDVMPWWFLIGWGLKRLVCLSFVNFHVRVCRCIYEILGACVSS